MRLAVILGSQIMKTQEKAKLAEHTRLKAQAAVCAYNEDPSIFFIVMGGYNFGVRYNETEILKNANFSPVATALAQEDYSEARVIKNFMVEKGVPKERIFIEETSSTTAEQASILKIILGRTTFKNVESIDVLSLASHLNKHMHLFLIERLTVKPLYAEDILFDSGRGNLVIEYYEGLKKRNPGSINFSIQELKNALENGGIAKLFIPAHSHKWEEKTNCCCDEYGTIICAITRVCSICGKIEFVDRTTRRSIENLSPHPDEKIMHPFL